MLWKQLFAVHSVNALAALSTHPGSASIMAGLGGARPAGEQTCSYKGGAAYLQAGEGRQLAWDTGKPARGNIKPGQSRERPQRLPSSIARRAQLAAALQAQALQLQGRQLGRDRCQPAVGQGEGAQLRQRAQRFTRGGAQRAQRGVVVPLQDELLQLREGRHGLRHALEACGASGEGWLGSCMQLPHGT